MKNAGTPPLYWLADVPLFISADRIRALYHASALPETEEEYRTISGKTMDSVTLTSSTETSTSVGVGGPIDILPNLNVELKTADGVIDTTTAEEGESHTLRPVTSPERQLLHLCLFYADKRPDRWSKISGDGGSGLKGGEWTEGTFIGGGARALVFVDIANDTPVIPMAAEVDGGRVLTFFGAMNSEAVVWGEVAPPKWPDENDSAEASEYWSWYMDSAHRRTSKDAMKLMEREIGAGGRPLWVDYRVPVTDESGQPVNSLHLHIQAGPDSATGDFAHRFVHRGRKHGLRVIGLLKEGPSVNVLAVYER